jgi:outer membrane protein assembly factor BamB
MFRITKSDARFQKRAVRWSVGLLPVALLAIGGLLHAQETRPARKIRVRLVAADAPARLVSDLHTLDPVTAGSAAAGGDSAKRPDAGGAPQAVGANATLWVRGATINRTFGFEQYYEGKFVKREGQRTIDLNELGVGEHVIDPGDHRFTIDAQGKITSNDPDITIDGDTVNLKLYRVDILPVDGRKSGPPASRLTPQKLGVFLTARDTVVTPTQLPALATSGRATGCPSVVSDPAAFCPLRIYLPANTVGPGYLLYPSYQAFHVKPGGTVAFAGTRVPGIDAQGLEIVIPYCEFLATVNSKSGLSGAVGQALFDARKPFNPLTLSPVLKGHFFTAGFGRPSTTFGLMVDSDFTKQKTLVFLADNMTPDIQAVRLMVLERGGEALESGSTVSLTLRLTENFVEFFEGGIANYRPVFDALRKPADAKEGTGLAGWLLGHVANDEDLKAIQAWQATTNAPEPAAAAKAAVLAMLNGALRDSRLAQQVTVAGVTLSEAARALLAQSPGADGPDAQLIFNRKLLAELFPGAFRPFQPTVRKPVVRMGYSRYNPHSVSERRWTEFEPLAWTNGVLTYKVPELPFDFYRFRVMVRDAEDRESVSSLSLEFPACVIGPGQHGAASFISNKGRDAFVAGEEIRLSVAIRSATPRAAGPRTVALRHPGGRTESFPVNDAGGTWWTQPLVLPADVTRNLKPGAYELSVTNLPAGIAQLPFRFDLVSAERTSPYLIIKPSKYTGPMYGLAGSQVEAEPNNLERAVASLAELGYNRIDLMHSGGHERPNNQREQMAAADERLMAPESVFTPSPRDQMLNACVRNRIEMSDVLLTYNDFHLPRYIGPYIDASRRWITRECLAMRHSPAFAGMMLYDEMYEWGLIGVPEIHTTLFPKIRNELAEQAMGRSPAKIRSEMSRAVSRPPGQRDPDVVKRFLDLRRWEMHGWGDFNTRVAAAAREVAPKARIGTYRTSFVYVTTGYGSIVSGTDFDCGYHPDVFENLDIASSIHYCDGPISGWVHSSMTIPLQRFGGRPRQVWANIPLLQEIKSKYDGQYSRHMAFAMLAQGADGVSLFGLPHDFNEGPNPGMIAGKESTKHLNNEILAPFGELVTRTDPGYDKVAIVYTLNQLSLSEFKEIRTANQVEELWIACWRLGYPAVFLREDAFEKSLDKYRVIFVPGIRFEGELTPPMLARLQEAINAGCKVVVERGSTLDLKGITRLEDFTLQNYFLGAAYVPANEDDELYRVFSKSQAAVDYFADKLPTWVEPTAKGPFTVGPNWRSSGDIHYLVMANFDDPDYHYMVAQFMAKPVRMPLTVSASRGRAAYDLLAQKPLPLAAATNGTETSLEVDMTRVQGALVAFLPEPVGKLQLDIGQTPDNRRVRISATLIGASGKPIAGLFPTTIRLLNEQGAAEQTYHRALGGTASFDLDLPGGPQTIPYRLEVRENISGQTALAPVSTPVIGEPSVRAEGNDPLIPYPDEVRRFLANNKEAILAVGSGMPELKALADELARGLAAKGIRVTVTNESRVGSFPAGNPDWPDSNANGFNSWRGGAITPAVAVDQPLILMTTATGSSLLHELAVNGCLTELPKGRAGLSVQPSIQVAARAFHPDHDTLCLVANDAEGLRKAVAALLGNIPASAQPPAPAPFAGKKSVVSAEATPVTPAIRYMGNNELVNDIRFDAAGNLYVITWGHGDNLYSLDPAGQVRFTRFLPEMGVSRLDMGPDRLLAFTSCGNRLYQVGLDGKPISQMRLSQDPGVSSGERAYHLAYAGYQYLPQLGWLLFNGRAMTLNGEIAGGWQSKTYVDKDTSDRELSRGMHSLALSPDGKRLAQIESQMYLTKQPGPKGDVIVPVYDSYLVLRDLQGKILAEYPQSLENNMGVSATVTWGARAPGPAVVVGGERLQFDAELTLLERKPALPAGLFSFGAQGRIERDGRALRYIGGDDREVSRTEPFDIIPTIARISPDGKALVFLDEYGLATVIETASGKTLAKITVPELGDVLVFAPDSSRFYLGGRRGSVMGYDLAGKPLWRTELGPHNKSLAKPLALYDPTFPDFTGKLWQEQRDLPGDLDKLVRFDGNRLVNGACESKDGWQGEQVAYADLGRESGHSLRVGASPVSQSITNYIGNHFTWVLEFHYRQAPGSKASRLLAGLRMESQDSAAVGRQFAPTDAWQFARVVIKSGKNPKSLLAGFSAEGGEVLVDDATLRRIRFPSVNHLLHEPVYEADPVVLTNPLFSGKYDPLGTLPEEIPNRLLIPAPKSGGGLLVEAAYLQNARLNDTTADWYVKPWPDGGDLKIAIGFKEPRWVSMIGVYFNAYDEKHATPNFDIYVMDADTTNEFLFASVRGNRKLFHLAKGEPRRAALITITLVNALWNQYTITEVEAYGPLGGREQAGFGDAEGQNTYMGNFARVDKRPKPLDMGALTAPWVGGGADWSFPHSQILAADGEIYTSRALGYGDRRTVGAPGNVLSIARAGTLGFAPHVTLYNGVLLKPGLDGSLYCIDPRSSRRLWVAPLGERLSSAPVAIGDDLFVADDHSRLLTLDFASGDVMRQVTLSGAARGSLACDGTNLFLITEDGLLQCIPAATGKPAWTVPVAKFSLSTPAVDNGMVYLADAAGTAKAVDAKTGRVVWSAELGQEFTGCPVVMETRIALGCRDGKLAVLDRATGGVLWQKQCADHFTYDPLPVQARYTTPEKSRYEDVLVHLDTGAITITRLDNGTSRREAAPRAVTVTRLEDGTSRELITGRTRRKVKEGAVEFEEDVQIPWTIGSGLLAPISYYRGALFFVPRNGDYGSIAYQSIFMGHGSGGFFQVVPAETKK